MKRFINILLYVVCIFLLISCEIGLGAAVDTEAPTVAITSPQAGSVIRDSFAVKGSWSDDGAISSIKVTLESTSNFIEPIVYDATVNLDEGSLVSGTWYCEINPESEGILDGEYKASVVISDFGGHTTTIPSYLLTVDNTAPLIVLQRPATKVNETADAYGQTFTLEGIGADDNSINKIDLNIYTDAECTNLVKTVSKSNVPASINLELATFEENTQNEYSDIYGSTTSNGTIVRYFKLIAYDSAKTYPLEGEGSELGNSTSTYYLYDDIYESVLGSYNATTIYQMLNGTYLATDASRTAASVSSVVKSLSENELNISKFSLNPRNNPKFSVSGRESLGDSEINLDASSYELTNGSEVVIEVSTGLDGISLNGSSLRPYVLPCGVNASLSVADTAENRIYLAEAGSGSKSGTSYKFVVTLDNAATAANTDVKLDVDSITPYYLFGVEGQDVKGNSVVANGNGYAIKFVSNGAAPDLSALQTSTDGSTWSSDSVVYIGKGKDLYIKGTVTVETGLASLAVFKDKTSDPTAICQDGSTTDPHTMYTSAVEGGQSSFEYKIDKSNFDQNVTKQYAIRLEATKNKTSSSTVTVRYDVEGPTIKNFMASPYTSDSTGDTRGLLNGTVTFSGLLSDAYSGLSSSNASWKVQKTDSLSDASWKDVAGLTGAISDPSEFSFTVDTTVDTTSDTTSVESSDTSIKYMRLVITAFDEAGNKSEITYDYTVDQSTDKPTVLDDGTTLNTSLSYADLRQLISNNQSTPNKLTKGTTVTFKLNDDDGFKDSTKDSSGNNDSSGLKISYKKKSADSNNESTFEASTTVYPSKFISIAGNPTGPTVTYTLPDEAGSYEIKLELTDMVENLKTSTNTYIFYVQLTGNAPTVSITTSPDFVTRKPATGHDSTFAKTEFTVNLTITEGSDPFTATRTNPDSKTKTLTVNASDPYYVITDTFTPTTTSSDSVVYTVTDTFGEFRELTFNYKIDSTAPSISSIKINTTEVEPNSNPSGWFDSKFLPLVVTAEDETGGSGNVSVEYVVLDSDSEADATSLADSEWTEMIFVSGEGYKSSASFNSDGENQKLYIRAIDGAGNVKYFNTDSTEANLDEYARHVPVQINIDTSTPDLSANYYQVGSGNVKAVSGSVYTNGSSPITVYGNYSDEVSGIQALTFKLGETTISPTVTYSTSEITSVYDITGRAADAAQRIDAVTAISFNVNESGESGITTENNKTIRSWKAVFTPRAALFGDESSRENKSLKLSVSGSNNASLPSSISPFNIVYDSTKPELSNLALATSSTSYSVYQPSSSEFSYYVNNTDGTFTISGNSSDYSGIDTVKVQLFKASNTSTTADLSNTFSDTAAYVWSYSGINIADWTDTSDTSDTRAVITATDNAGNSTSKEMTLKFDTSAPTVSHGLDAKNKDLYLRVGSNDNDDIDSSSTNPQWSKALDTDVGGKYSSATYGNALTMQIRGYFEDENGGSGASKVYYYVTQNDPPQTDDALKSLVLASPTGTITKLPTEQEKRVFYNVTADATDSYGGTLFSEGDSYDKYYKKIPSNFSESLSGFATGKNYLVFVVTDNVGNSRLDTCSDGTQSYNYFTINIDQIGPVITTNTTDIMYSNGGSGIISLSGTVTDADAGVKSLSISVTTSQVNTYTATLGNSNTWTASVPNSIFASLSGNYTLTATAVDKAGTGNTSTLPVATILVDTTAPTLTLNSPTDADTSTNTTEINGRISLGGSASDANGLSTSDNLTLYYTWSESIKNKTDANLVPSDFGTDAKSKWVKISSISAVNNWTFNNINTVSLEKEYEENETPKTTLYLMASAKDKAGNTGYSNRVTAIVDQDSDRPIIKFTNLELSTEMASSTPLPFASNSLYGSVTDDDGIISIKYKIGEDGEFTTVSGSNGSFNISLSDGSKNLSFEVTDCESVVLSEKPDDWNTEASTLYYTNKECTTAASTTFQSGTYYLKKTFTSSSNDSYNQATPKLTDSNGNKYAYRDSTSGKKISVTYLKVDTKKPDVLSLEYTKTPADESSWSTSASTYGGTNANNFCIRQFAYDANGIADSKGETTIATDTYGTRLKVEKKANDNAVTGYTAADENYYYYALTKEKSSTRVQNGKTYTEWRSSVVNTGGMESGNRNAIFEVFDGTSPTETEAIIVIDNTCPVISVSAPDSSQNSKGNVTAYGETDLTDWKKTSTSKDYTEHMYYALSFDDSTTPATDKSESALANVTAITSWKDEHDNNGSSTINYKPYYSEIIGGSFSWYVYFDGGQTTTASHDVTFKQFLINSGVTTQALIESTNSDEKFTTVVKAYLWIKAVDEVGNYTVVKHEILIDPQGDAPTVTLAYPESSGTTLGGEISLRGIATDDYGNTIGVDSVWAQIISAIENGYDSSTVTSTGTQTCGGLSFVDTVTSSGSGDSTKYSHAYTLSSFAPTMHDVHQWIEKGYKVYTNITSDTPTQVTSASASDESGANYYIKATLSGSAWSLAINGRGEFDPDEGKLNPIAYRIFAKDKDNNLSRYQQQLSVYDSDTPVISGLYLRQYADNENGEGAVTASRAYQDDMWVKGTWWLYGTVEDTQGLSSLKVGPETSKVNQTITGNAAAKETFNYLLSTGSGVGSLALVIEASDKASPVHSIPKKLVINYDNTPPELVTSGSDFNISSTVQNSNGFYSFGSQVTENVVGSYSQSGFAYLAFWFERDITGKHVVYDVMRSKANSEINYGALTSDSGLMWKSVSVGRSSSSLGTLTLSSLDPNIHVGGLCKIAGSIYLISSVSADGLTIGIDGQPEYTAASETALFAIANVVNNNVESGSGTKSITDGLYGYYSSISNDDGDHMVESVSKSGTSWNWEANINSQNMADGSVTLHYAAFDNAGNYVEGSVRGNVANNAPRIASLEVWSDFNENGSKDSGEYETKYYQGKERKIGGVYTTRASKVTDELVVSGNDNDYNASGSAFMTVKATTRFTPELIGGNGALYYSYKYGTSSTLASATTYIGSATIGNGTDNGIDETIDNEGYYIQDQNGLGYINGSTSAYMEIPGAGTGYTLSALGNSTSSTDPTWFEYTIYDSTEGSGTWSTTSLDSDNRLSAKFRVALNVQYNDTKPPVVKIRPFYWNSKTENSVCWDSYDDAEGHIELEADITNEIAALTAVTTALGSDDPKVSGKIKIEGYAFDDIKLNSLYGIVSNHTNLSITTGTLLSTYNGAWASTAYSADTGWGFEAEDVYCNGDGHLVKWTLTIDTAKRTTAAQLDQTVVVYAKDDRSNAESAHSGTTQTSLTSYVWSNVKDEDNAITTYYTDFYCNTPVNSSTSDTAIVYKADDLEDMTSYYKMDIVPYITELTTELTALNKKNPSTYGRTSLGKYPVYYYSKADDGSVKAETIVVKGFNLSSASIKVNGVDTAINLDSNSAFTLTDAVKSGEIYALVNEIQSLNNVNNDDGKGSYTDVENTDTLYKNYQHYYNRQANNINNDLLTDNVELAVWGMNAQAVLATSGLIKEPIMHVNPTNGLLGFGFLSGAERASYPNGASNSYEQWSWGWTSVNAMEFIYDWKGRMFGTQAGTDTYTPDSKASRFRIISSNWGKTLDGTDNMSDANTCYSAYHALRLDYMGKPSPFVASPNRFVKPKLASAPGSSANLTNVYLLYYDDVQAELRFRAGTINAEGSKPETTDFKQCPVSYGDFVDDAYHQNSKNNNNYATVYTNCSVLANTETEHKAGSKYSIAVVPSAVNGKDVVVAVWQDAVNGDLLYSYMVDPLTNNHVNVDDTTHVNPNWNPPKTILDGSSGGYCSIAVDENKHIHIASFSTENAGSLVYTYLDSYDSSYDKEKNTCIIDSYGTSGWYLNMEIAKDSNGNNIPYISYFTTSMQRPKYAYLVDTRSSGANGNTWAPKAGADDEDMYTQSWETMMLPLKSSMIADDISIGVYRYATAENGHLKGEIREIPKITESASSTTGTVGGNGTANPVFAYGISYIGNGYIETAQLK